MINRVNIYFEDGEFRRNLEAYCQEHGKSFSETVLEFARGGYSLFQKTGSMNIDLLMEKVSRLEEAKREIEFLRQIIKANLFAVPGTRTNTSSPLDVEKETIDGKASVNDANPPPGSIMEMPPPTQKQESVEKTDAGHNEPLPRRIIR
jgi:hypothetical protein